MDPEDPVVKLCVEGMQAEGRGDVSKARSSFAQAWEAATDDYKRCIAAHYVARHRDTAESTLQWNEKAMRYAESVNDPRVEDFFPSLLLNLGHSHEQLGNRAEAIRFYDLAVARADPLPEGRYGRIVLDAAIAGQRRLAGWCG